MKGIKVTMGLLEMIDKLIGLGMVLGMQGIEDHHEQKIENLKSWDLKCIKLEQMNYLPKNM